jgi:hypothetical protein
MAGPTSVPPDCPTSQEHRQARGSRRAAQDWAARHAAQLEGSGTNAENPESRYLRSDKEHPGIRGTPRRPPDCEWAGTWLGEGVGIMMDHGKGAGTTEPAPVRVSPADDRDSESDAGGPMTRTRKPGGTKSRARVRPSS